MSPHCSAIFLQHSRSADVIAAPGNTHAATGSAASISARAETPTLIASLTPISLVQSLEATDQEKFQMICLIWSLRSDFLASHLASIDKFAAILRLVTSREKRNSDWLDSQLPIASSRRRSILLPI